MSQKQENGKNFAESRRFDASLREVLILIMDCMTHIMALLEQINHSIKALDFGPKLRSLIMDGTDSRGLGVGVVLTDRKGTLISVTNYNTLGHELGSLLNHKACEFLPPESHSVARKLIRSAAHEGGLTDAEIIRVRDGAGDWCPLRVKAMRCLVEDERIEQREVFVFFWFELPSD